MQEYRRLTPTCAMELPVQETGGSMNTQPHPLAGASMLPKSTRENNKGIMRINIMGNQFESKGETSQSLYCGFVGCFWTKTTFCKVQYIFTGIKLSEKNQQIIFP